MMTTMMMESPKTASSFQTLPLAQDQFFTLSWDLQQEVLEAHWTALLMEFMVKKVLIP